MTDATRAADGYNRKSIFWICVLALVTALPIADDLLRKTDAIVIEFHHVGIKYDECLRCLNEAGLTKRQVLVDKKIVTTELFLR